MFFFRTKEKTAAKPLAVYKDNNGREYRHCLMMVANLVISHNDSEEDAQSERENFLFIQQLCKNKYRVSLSDYKEGIKTVYSQGKLTTSKMNTTEPVDMDCVKEAIIQMNDEKKIKTNKLGVVERIISDGLIGGGKEKMTAREFIDFLKGFIKVTSATYYAGRPASGKIAEWMASENKDTERKKIVSFATKFIQKYSELKETKL